MPTAKKKTASPKKAAPVTKSARPASRPAANPFANHPALEQRLGRQLQRVDRTLRSIEHDAKKTDVGLNTELARGLRKVLEDFRSRFDNLYPE